MRENALPPPQVADDADWARFTAVVTEIVPDVTMTLRPDHQLVADLGFDSLGGLDLLCSLNKTYGVHPNLWDKENPDARPFTQTTLQDVLDAVQAAKPPVQGLWDSMPGREIVFT